MCYLQENNVPFYIRVKANMLVPHGNDQKHIGDYFKHLRIGEVRRLEKEMYGFPCTFEGTRTKKGDLIIIMSNQVILSPGEILKKYKKRWSIEKLFKNLKSDGFNWEMTHMKDPKRLVKLLIILSLSCLCCSLVGLTVKIPWRSTVECPLVCAFKAGLKRIQYYISNNIDCFIEKMLNLLDSSKSIFKKNADSQLTLLDFQGIWNK